MQRDSSVSWWRRLRFGRAGWWLTLAVAVACAAIIACQGASEPDTDLARELGTQLSDELRAYRDAGLEASLQSARATCVEIQAEATSGRLYGTDYGQLLASACDVVNVLGVEPSANVETPISVVDLALEMLR